MAKFTGIPVRVQRAVEAVGGCVDQYDRRANHMGAYLTAPDGKLWSATGTHDLTLDMFLPFNGPQADAYWRNVMEDLAEGVMDCDNGETADTAFDGKCERCGDAA